MDYALLIYRATPLSEPLPEIEERRVLAAHRALQTEAAAEQGLYAVARLADTHTARTVRPRAGAHEVSDGPFMETKEWLVGFYVVRCDDEQQALDRARQLCVDGSHCVEVRPLSWRWKP